MPGELVVKQSMDSAEPFFSVIIPTYNRAALVEATIKSVLRQSFEQYEIIVVDDGSSDNTEDIIMAMNNAKISWYKKENGERGAARNYGWENSRGKYVTFLDSDDLLYDNHLEEAYHFFVKEKDAVCYAQAYEIKNAANNQVLRPAYKLQQKTINEKILSGNFLSCFGVFIKKEIFPTFKFESDRKFAGTEDWLLWLQLSSRFPFYYNNAVTGALQEHSTRSVLSFNEDSLLYRATTLKAKLKDDVHFISVFGAKSVDKIYAHMLSYTSLHLAIAKKKKKAMKYLLKAILLSPNEVLTKRSLSITKKILFA